MLGIIGGSNAGLRNFETVGKERIVTPFGQPSDDVVFVRFAGKEIRYLLRHGPHHLPPHRVNHQANVYALKNLGVSEIIGISSVGSLKPEIPPGSVVVPHDFLSPWDVRTFHEEYAVHITPRLDDGLRTRLIDAAIHLGLHPVTQAVYIQTTGPRLETRAEIAMLRHFGELVGMTMAHEATLAQEQGMAYASLCSVDNFCHGIGETTLTQDEIVRCARDNAHRIEQVLTRMVESLP